MSQQSRSTIKSYFQTGDIPTQQEYVHLIDSFVALTNDTNSGSIELTGSLNVSGTLTGTTATITSADLTDLTVSGTGSFSKITVGTDATENSEATGQTTDPVEVSVMGDISASGIVYGRRMVTNQFDIGVLNSDNPLLKIFAGISSSEAVIDDGDPAIFSEKGISFTLNSSGDDETDGSSISGSVGSTFKIFQTDPGQTSGLAGVLSKKVFEIDYSGSIGQVNNITASGNISCSGTVIADNFTSTGGDDQITFTDDLYVNGNITASGNISGSNDIKGKFITASNTLYLGNTNTSISDVSYGKIVAGTILSDTPINVFQTTANGQLIFGQYENANHIQISSSNFKVKAKGDVTFDINGEDFKLHKSDGSGNDTAYFNFNLTSPNPQLDVDGTTFNIVPTGGNTFFDSNITSSGDISSSSDILASSFKSKDKIIGLYHGGSDTVRLASTLAKSRIDGTNIKLDGPVTASSHISASGTGSYAHLQLPFGARFTGRKNGAGTVELLRNVGVTTATFGDPTIGSVYLYGNNVFVDSANGNIRLRDDGSTKITFDIDGSDQIIKSEDNLILRADSSDITLDAQGNNIYFKDFDTQNIEFNTNTGLISSSGNITAKTLKIDGSQVDFTGLPTSNSGLPAGRLYRDGNDVKIAT